MTLLSLSAQKNAGSSIAVRSEKTNGKFDKVRVVLLEIKSPNGSAFFFKSLINHRNFHHRSALQFTAADRLVALLVMGVELHGLVMTAIGKVQCRPEQTAWNHNRCLFGTGREETNSSTQLFAENRKSHKSNFRH
jgi:hypothetical protein